MKAIASLVCLLFLADGLGDDRSMAGSASDPIDESLVLHYTFDYPDTFGLPGEQRLVRDRSPHGNDGRIINKPEALPELDGRFGVLRFGGQETYIECGDDDSLFIGGDQTIEMWVRRNSLVRSKSRFAHIYGDANASNFLVAHRGGRGVSEVPNLSQRRARPRRVHAASRHPQVSTHPQVPRRSARGRIGLPHRFG
jgi:hypothetical protein